MAMELTGAVDDIQHGWDDADQDATARMLRAIDAFGHDARAQERARTAGLGRVLVLLIGLAILVAVGITIHDLVNETVQDIDRGM